MSVFDRRRVLKTIAAGGMVAMAGCSSSGEPNSDCPKLDQEPNYGDWFDGVSNYDGTCDFRDSDSVEVAVGTKGNDAFWAFDPPAIAITTGTTVQWKWTGRGGPHNVVSRTGVLDSGPAVEGEDTEFEYSFESPGLHRYVCEPHESPGMKGAVFVALD